MSIEKVVVAGGGVLGSQIAYQSAFCGFDVTVWLRSEGSIERAKPKFERLLNIYLGTLEKMKTDKTAYCRGFSKKTT
jgi:3-hydroxybutyryl-CoA dehydrogenase